MESFLADPRWGLTGRRHDWTAGAAHWRWCQEMGSSRPGRAPEPADVAASAVDEAVGEEDEERGMAVE